MTKYVAAICICILGISFTTIAYAGINLSAMDFNYDMYQVNGSKAQQPLEVFSGNGKTYIKFPPNIINKNKPALYIAKDEYGGTPEFYWKKPYIIIDGIVNYMKLVDPRTGKTLFNIQRVNAAYIPVIPSPYVTNYTMDGFFVNLGIGVGNVGSSSMNNFSANAAIGWDWAFSDKVSRHWLMGFEFGGAFGGYTDGTGVSAPSGSNVNGFNPKVISWDVDLLFRMSYIFFSGVYITAKAGGAYLQDRVDAYTDANNTTVNAFNNDAIVPEIAAEFGYMMSSGMNFGLRYNYLFGLKDTVDNGVLSANIGFHF